MYKRQNIIITKKAVTLIYIESSRLRLVPGELAAHANHPLWLLDSSPDQVREFALRKARQSTPQPETFNLIRVSKEYK